MTKFNSSVDEAGSATARARRLPSLPALRAFEATARLGSALLAAQELSVTPTAISHQIRALEQWLGTALFVRQPRRLVPTPAAHELRQVTSDAFDRIAWTTDKLRTHPQRHTLTLSTTPAIARMLLTHTAALRAARPGLDLRIHATHEPVPLDGVIADMAIRYGSGQWPGLVAEHLVDNRFVPACSPALKLRQRASLPRHALLHFLPLGARSSPSDWAAWQRVAKVPGLDAAAGPVFHDETHVIAAALAGQGVGLMSQALIARELAEGRLVRPFGPDLQGAAFHLVYPQSRRADPDVQAVRDWVLGVAAVELVPG